jgi:glycosyltransferase involved in cell wall biosynthesis
MRLAATWLDRELPTSSTRLPAIRAVVPVGVEEEWFKPEDPVARDHFHRRFPELTRRRIVLFFGRLSFKKGMDLLAQAFIEVAQQLDDVHLVVAGPDTEGYGVKVREWLRAGGVLEKVTFTGALSGEDRFVALKQAEVFVLPSYTENFGQAVAEAMACAVPVVISDRVNIWPEVKEAGAGLVVSCDAHETAQAILTLLDNPALGKEMGLRGRKFVEEKLTWKMVGQQLLRVYEQVARKATALHALPDPSEERLMV